MRFAKPCGKALRRSRPRQFQSREPLAGEGGGKAAHDGLDLGKFGHGSGAVWLGAWRCYLAKMGGKETSDQSSGLADFGFSRVSEAEKTRRVRGVFDRVAKRYDLMNDLMSGGIHRLWKARLIDRLNPRPGQTLLDLAGGTGDIARRFLDRAGSGGFAIVCDINESHGSRRARPRDRQRRARRDRLDRGRRRKPAGGERERRCLHDLVRLRNVTRIARALSEARRVLKPGGRFLCLEFSRVEAPLLRRAYDALFLCRAAGLGQAVARDRDAYRYLVESIRRFPPQAELAAMMRGGGFRAGELAQPVGRHRRDSFRLAALAESKAPPVCTAL